MTTLNAHPIARGAIVIAAALLVSAVVLLLNDGSEAVPADVAPTAVAPRATATPEVTPTPTASPTATPEPTATPRPGPEPAFGELPPALETSEAGTWVRQVLAAGEEPRANHGVLIRNLESGGSEHWSLAEGPGPGAQFFAYGVAGDGRFATFGNPFEPSMLVDRESGTAFEWDVEELRFLAAAPDGRILLTTASDEDGTCLYWAVDLSAGDPLPLLRFGIDVGRFCRTSAVFDPAGTSTLTVGAGSPDGGTLAYAIDVAAGTVDLTTDASGVTGLGSGSSPTVWVDTSGTPDQPPIELTVTRYDAPADAIAAVSFDATADGGRIGPILVAPNSRFVAWQESLRLGGTTGLGGWMEWPVTAIGDSETGEVVLRVTRAALTTGAVNLGWLADSTGIVLAAEGEFVLLEFAGAEGGIDASSATLSSFPFVHETHFSPPPEPSPADRALFAYDGRFVDAAGTDAYAPISSDWIGSSQMRGGWTSGGGEYYLGSFDPGPGDFGAGPLAPIGLAPRLELPPFTNDVRLVVTEATELHQTFALDSAASWALDAGTAVTVENDPSAEECFSFGCATVIDRNSGLETRPWWIFVRTDDGRAGWAQSSVLAWAP